MDDIKQDGVGSQGRLTSKYWVSQSSRTWPIQTPILEFKLLET